MTTFCLSEHREQLRFQHGAQHIHRLGPRAIAEFLAEIGREHRCTAGILDLLDAYHGRLTHELLAAVGGDRFPPLLSEVP